MRLSRLSLVTILALSGPSFAASTNIGGTFWGLNSEYGAFGAQATPITNALGVPLAAGTAAPGDGTIIQIGIFGPGVPADPAAFTEADWASFVPLTGMGSSYFAEGPEYNTTMGDGGPPDGFYTHSGISWDDAGHPELTGGRLGIRIFDTTDLIANPDAQWNTATTSFWTLPAPSTNPVVGPTIYMDTAVGESGNRSADFAPLVWESGAAGAFRTVVPEPSTTLLGLLGGLLLLRRRR